MTQHTQIKENKYSTNDKPKFDFIKKTLHYGPSFVLFYTPQTQRPKIVSENVDPNIMKCTQLERT